MVRLLIEERYTWPVRTVLLGGGGLRATSYQIMKTCSSLKQRPCAVRSASGNNGCANSLLNLRDGNEERSVVGGDPPSLLRRRRSISG